MAPASRLCGGQATNWEPGDVLYAGGTPAYRIRTVIPMDDLDNEVYDGILEVEPAS